MHGVSYQQIYYKTLLIILIIVLLMLCFGTTQSCLWSPTDHLFEVAVEVNFSQDLEKSWDDLASSLLLSVKALVC